MPSKKKIAKDLENNFRRDFQKLLEKYGAEIDITDGLFGEAFGTDPSIVVTMESTWDDNHDQVTPFVMFTLQ